MAGNKSLLVHPSGKSIPAAAEQQTAPCASWLPAGARGQPSAGQGSSRVPSASQDPSAAALQTQSLSLARASHCLLLPNLSTTPNPQVLFHPSHSLPPLSALLQTSVHRTSARGFQHHLLSSSNPFFISVVSPRVPVISVCSMSSANVTSSPPHKSLIKTENRLESRTGPFGTLTSKARPDLQASNDSYYLKQISPTARGASHTSTCLSGLPGNTKAKVHHSSLFPFSRRLS